MEYVLGLKKEVGLLNENEAKERYLELLAQGYSERDIIFATPVPVQGYLNIEQATVANAYANYNQVNGVDQAISNDSTGNTQYTNVSGLNFGGDELPSDTLS